MKSSNDGCLGNISLIEQRNSSELVAEVVQIVEHQRGG